MAKRYAIQRATHEAHEAIDEQPAALDGPGDFWAACEEFRRTHDLTSDPIDPDEVFGRDKSPDRDFSW